jgi:hypothetical protein
MSRKYLHLSNIEALVASFENATIDRDAWKHAEHLVVALVYLEDSDLAHATDKMRAGLMNLLENGFKVDLSKEMPYHETLTVFWMRTVFAFSLMHKQMPLLERANSLVKAFDKDYPLEFYSREFLFSDTARTMFLDGDLRSKT